MTPGPDPEAGYYQAIEEFFVSRRGDPLFLSNADWLLVRRWRRQGIPLRVVLRGIADALDAHAHSWGRGRRVGSLAYCRGEVEAAMERWHHALALGATEGLDLAATLRGFAAALEKATGLGHRGAAAARRLAPELRERAAAPGSSEGLDTWLADEEAGLLKALGADLGKERVDETAAAVDADLAPYRGRMPESVLRQIRDDALARRLLEVHGLPRLSLFHQGA